MEIKENNFNKASGFSKVYQIYIQKANSGPTSLLM